MIAVETPANPSVIGNIYGDLLAKANTIDTTKLRIEDFRPGGNHLLVRPAPSQTTTKGGLHLPQSAIQPSKIGTVVAAPEACGYEVGDTVLFRGGGGCQLMFEGEEFLLLEFYDTADSDILGKFLTVPPT